MSQEDAMTKNTIPTPAAGVLGGAVIVPGSFRGE